MRTMGITSSSRASRVAADATRPVVGQTLTDSCAAARRQIDRLIFVEDVEGLLNYPGMGLPGAKAFARVERISGPASVTSPWLSNAAGW